MSKRSVICKTEPKKCLISVIKSLKEMSYHRRKKSNPNGYLPIFLLKCINIDNLTLGVEVLLFLKQKQTLNIFILIKGQNISHHTVPTVKFYSDGLGLSGLAQGPAWVNFRDHAVWRG